MAGAKKAVLISEAGWRGIRELALSFLKNGLCVDVIIKGSVEKEVLAIITRPNSLKIKAIPKWFFKLYLFFYILWHKMIKDVEPVVASKEQTMNWIKGLGLNAKLLIETREGYELR